jgi:hypothetical protein
MKGKIMDFSVGFMFVPKLKGFDGKDFEESASSAFAACLKARTSLRVADIELVKLDESALNDLEAAVVQAEDEYRNRLHDFRAATEPMAAQITAMEDSLRSLWHYRWNGVTLSVRWKSRKLYEPLSVQPPKWREQFSLPVHSFDAILSGGTAASRAQARVGARRDETRFCWSTGRFEFR